MLRAPVLAGNRQIPPHKRSVDSAKQEPWPSWLRIFPHGTQDALRRLEERLDASRNDGALNSTRNDGPTGSQLHDRSGHVAVCAAAAERTRCRRREIEEGAGERTPIGHGHLDGPAAALDRQHRTERQCPVCRRHCATVKDAP
jgi:hypothetical protein